MWSDFDNLIHYFKCRQVHRNSIQIHGKQVRSIHQKNIKNFENIKSVPNATHRLPIIHNVFAFLAFLLFIVDFLCNELAKFKNVLIATRIHTHKCERLALDSLKIYLSVLNVLCYYYSHKTFVIVRKKHMH